IDDLELALEVRRARGDLVGLRVAVAGRPALHDVGDEDLLAPPADRGEEADEQLAGAADERPALGILGLAGTLADEHDLGVRMALAGHGLRPPLGELAAGAGTDLRGDRLQGGSAFLGRARDDGCPARRHAGASTAARRPRARTQPRATSASASSTALVAAPLRRLSETTQKARPRPSAIDGSWRTRPTKISSRPAASVASGYSCMAGSSLTTTPSTSPNSRRARSGVIGSLVSTWTASEWLTKTGTRTAVQEMRSSGRCRILRLSVTTFHSSFV